MHGATREEKEEKVRRIVQYIGEISYRKVRHLESGTVVTPFNSSIAAQGHLYCTAGL
jgi:hypothetical protein